MHQLPHMRVAIGLLQPEGFGLPKLQTQLGNLTPLKESIKRLGVLNPPIVWRIRDKGREHFVLIDGRRRVAAIAELVSGHPNFQDEYRLHVAVFEGPLSEATKLRVDANRDGDVHSAHHGDEALPSVAKTLPKAYGFATSSL